MHASPYCRHINILLSRCLLYRRTSADYSLSNEFIAQLAAVQTKQRTGVGRSKDGSAKALSAHADLCVLLAYLGEFEERWPAAVQYSHLFERVVGRRLEGEVR